MVRVRVYYSRGIRVGRPVSKIEEKKEKERKKHIKVIKPLYTFKGEYVYYIVYNTFLVRIIMAFIDTIPIYIC